METGVIVVFITAPSQDVAEKVASYLIENRLAACVNILPAVRSLFTWQGKTQNEHEVMLVVKTRLELFHTQLIPAVKSVHPYQVPEIIAFPVIAGSPDYLEWIRAETASS